jgi:hypothetical protein
MGWVLWQCRFHKPRYDLVTIGKLWKNRILNVVGEAAFTQNANSS